MPRLSLNDALKLEDLDILIYICLHCHHLASIMRMSPHEKRGSKVLMNAGRYWGILIGCHTMNEAVHHKEGGTRTSSNDNYGLLQP